MKTFTEFCEETEQVDESLAAGIFLTLQLALAALPIQKAAALLPGDLQDQLNSLPPIELVQDWKARGVSRNTEGWVRPSEDGSVIHISGYTDLYKKAAAGNRDALIKLASIIAHELTHAQGNYSEKQAYATQVKVLRALHAPQSMIDQVELNGSSFNK